MTIIENMKTELDGYYSLSSAWAYFAGPQQQDVVRRYRVGLMLKPYNFQAVVPTTGGVPFKTRPEPRRSHHALELARWRDYLPIPLTQADYRLFTAEALERLPAGDTP